jgi:outer membrane protein W
MRSIRLAAAALLLTAAAGMTPSSASAQTASTASWQDSWFWGVYGGQMQFPTVIATTTAPTIGLDWVITRTNFALNVFADQSYFTNAPTTITDSGTTTLRRVQMTDMRRVGFSAMIFTPQYKMFKPYVGAGYSFNFIKDATPEGASTGTVVTPSVARQINTARSAGKLFGNIGVMALFGRYAPFAEYTVMPTQGKGGWLVNGDGFTTVWKVGLRYNFGGSIQKQW